MKIFLISHIADADGIMPVILTDLTFDEYDYKLLDIKDVDSFVLESIDNNLFDNYDKVIMTDLCISDEVAQKINNIDLKNKFLVLDHHYGNLDLNKYPFIKVVVENNGIKESGTSLYYEYLINNFTNNNIMKESVNYMVRLVQLGDTWEWVKYDVPEARDLVTLLSYYGLEKFINKYTKFLRKNKEFYFDEAEQLLIEIDKNKKDNYFKLALENIIFKEIKGYKTGIVFAEEYRSELGNYLAQYYKDKIDLVIIINLNRSISYRCVKDDINVSDFASFFGGKGHAKAAGSPLKEDIKEIIIEELFGD